MDAINLHGKLSYDFLGSFAIERLAVPMFASLNPGQALAFCGSGQHDCRTAPGLLSLFVRRKQFLDVMAIYRERLPSKRLPSGFVNLQMVLKHGRLALTQPVD